MASKLVNLVAIATLAILASFGPTDVSALSLEGHHFVRHNTPHQALARRAEQKSTTNRRRCKARPVSSSLVSSAPAVPSSSKAAAPKVSSNVPAPPPAPKPQSSLVPAPPKQSSTKAASPPKETPKPAPAPAPAPPPPVNDGRELKVGIAWNGRNANSLANFLRNPRVGFCLTWSPYACPGIANFKHVQNLPMIWGYKDVDRAKSVITSTNYAKWILGPNEPNHRDQANMDVGTGVTFWRNVMQPYGARGHKLVAPAPTNGEDGFAWISSFMKQCQGCQVDAMGAHWYGVNKQNFIDHVMKYRNAFGRRVFVTEFACQNFSGGAQCNVDEIWDFIKTTTKWMDGYEGVRAYFAYGVLDSMGNVNENNRLMDRNSGQPTPLGYAYLGN